METRQFEDLTYTLRRSSRRQTIGLTVERDGKLTVAAPEACSDRMVEKLLAQKRFWIYNKLAEQERLVANRSRREIVSGQGFPYLGRTYRLRLVDLAEAAATGRTEALWWHHGYFVMLRSEQENGRGHFQRWYTERAGAKLAERLALYQPQLQVEAHKLRVMDLGYRWGSCGKGRVLYFNWRLIMAPIRVIDYVVVHELLHLHSPYHSPDYWKRLLRALPDFVDRKQWLAEHGAELSVWGSSPSLNS